VWVHFKFLQIPVRGLHVGRYPPQPVSVLGPSFLLAQAIFKPNLFPYKYSNIFKPSHPSYLSAYEDGTECSETPAYKIQTPGNYPEESIRHSEHGKSLKSRMCSFLLQNDHYRKPAFNVTVNNIVLQFAIHQKGMEDPTKYISPTISMYLAHYSQCMFCSVELHY
jgi:hypothetical protein